MMIKVCSAHGWPWDEPVVRAVPIASGGLRGHDRREFFKRASHAFEDILGRVKAADGEELAHAIAVGATQTWGANRNGDGFKSATCRQWHPTFVKFAKCYRNHKNTDPALSYGVIKAAVFNEAMQRIELLCAYNRTKEAAERNGGLIADRELEKLARGDDMAGSMACRIEHDECSWCHNRARTRDDYCTTEKCAAGGCADNLAKLVKVGNDVHHLHVENPGPYWFDWSDVHKPAERTGYGTRADWFAKEAADNFAHLIGGAKVAEDLQLLAPLAVIVAQSGADANPRHLTFYKLAHGLAQLAQRPGVSTALRLAWAARTALRPEDLGLTEKSSEAECDEALAALADAKVVLPLADYAAWTKRAELAPTAQAHVRQAWQHWLRVADTARRHEDVATKCASWRLQALARGAAPEHSLDLEHLQRRAQLASLRGSTPAAVKQASTTEPPTAAAAALLADYAGYKLAALTRIAAWDDEFVLTAPLALQQNEVN
jgi:hypothetical protein